MKLALFRLGLVAAWSVVAFSLGMAILTATKGDSLAGLLMMNTGIAASVALDGTFKYRDRPQSTPTTGSKK